MLTLSALALILVFLSVSGMLINRFGADRRRAFVWTLAVTAEKGIPLSQVAAACAREYAGYFGERLSRLSQLLGGGTPLTTALRSAGIRLPTESQLSLELAEHTGRLPQTLKRLADSPGDIELPMRAVQERLAYLLLVLTCIMSLLGFMGFKIMPTMQEIFLDFQIADSPQNAWLTEMSIVISRFFWLPMLLCVGLLLAWLALLVHYSGVADLSWLAWKLPILNRIAPRGDGVIVLRALGEKVEQNVPLPEALDQLARFYPKRHLRVRLERMAKRVAGGHDPWRLLAAAGFIVKSEAAVLRSAQSAGNLAWALEEMAEGNTRRMLLRTQWAMTIVYPITILALSLLVGFIIVNFMAGIMALTEGLA